MASGNPTMAQVPLWSSSNFNIGINLPGVPSGLGTQQQAQNNQKAPGAGLKAKKQVILEDDDDVSVWCSRWYQQWVGLCTLVCNCKDSIPDTFAVDQRQQLKMSMHSLQQELEKCAMGPSWTRRHALDASSTAMRHGCCVSTTPFTQTHTHTQQKQDTSSANQHNIVKAGYPCNSLVQCSVACPRYRQRLGSLMLYITTSVANATSGLITRAADCIQINCTFTHLAFMVLAPLLPTTGHNSLQMILYAHPLHIHSSCFLMLAACCPQQEIGDDAEGYENFATVSSNALEGYGLAPHPSPVCEAATLSSVPSPECDYTLKLPGHVLKSECTLLLLLLRLRLSDQVVGSCFNRFGYQHFCLQACPAATNGRIVCGVASSAQHVSAG
jgi:hypothetical protein